MSILMLLLALVQPATPAASIQAVNWLTGCWTLTEGSRTVREHWMGADGGTMLGMARTVRDGRTVEFEFLQIREAGGSLEYVARPSGQPATTFTASGTSERAVVFENPAHDFPTRIRYERLDAGLMATISGKADGRTRSIEFRYVPADCTK
jgi:hypothetical protein